MSPQLLERVQVQEHHTMVSDAGNHQEIAFPNVTIALYGSYRSCSGWCCGRGVVDLELLGPDIVLPLLKALPLVAIVGVTRTTSVHAAGV
jgi:hypothetical protein